MILRAEEKMGIKKQMKDNFNNQNLFQNDENKSIDKSISNNLFEKQNNNN